MCGINGIIITTNPLDYPRQLLCDNIASMNHVLAHRGPDGDGVYVDNGIALGHRRLSILDLSAEGNQPMFNEDRSLVLVFNGEIYNYLELVHDLKALGHLFHSHSDSEVILHSYEEWGADCVQRFNGMWAFALWDKHQHRLFASRDRFGVKPFYYVQEKSRFIFSSEIKGIAAVKVLAKAHLGKVHDYLRYGYRTSDGRTFFAEVHELKPGHSLIIENGKLNLFRYWKMPDGKISKDTDKNLSEHFSALLEDAIRLRFRSDVPIALLQSGGLDSSAICRVVDDDIAAGRLGCDSVTAFTAVFPGFKYDESVKVRELISTCKNIQLIELTPTSDDLLADLQTFVTGMGEPLQSTTSFVHWQIMRAVHKRGIKVVINGQGADEALAGYGPYIVGYRLLDTLLSRPWEVLGQAHGMRDKMGFSASKLFAQTAKAMLGRRAASKWRARIVEGGTQVLTPAFCSQNDHYLEESSMTLSPRNLDQLLRAQIEHYGFNQILHYEDQSSMLNSVEIRSPFVDYRIMEFAFSLPDRLKLNHGVTKLIQRDAFSARLPKSIVENHHKIGFATPFANWMDDSAVKEFMRELVYSSTFQERTIWNGKDIKKCFDQPDKYAAFPFWRFINLELWARSCGITNL